MGKVVRLNESQLNNIIKNVIKENQEQFELASLTNKFNQEVGVDLTPQEYKDMAVCPQNVEQLDMNQVPAEHQAEAKKVFEQIKQKAKTADKNSLKVTIRTLRRQMKNNRAKNRQRWVSGDKNASSLLAPTAGALAGAEVLQLLGVAVSPYVIIYIGAALLVLAIYSFVRSGNSGVNRNISCAAYR